MNTILTPGKAQEDQADMMEQEVRIIHQVMVMIRLDQ
jgi:hypothetical protein